MDATSDDDDHIEYGNLYTFNLGDKKQTTPQKEIWPHWDEGVPTKFRRLCWSPGFTLGLVRHDPIERMETVNLTWNSMQFLHALRAKSHLLPSARYSSEWRGVYRIFAPDRRICRLCGTDPTGTLYLGKAGSERGWSILRTRLMEVSKKSHHATQSWSYGKIVERSYPWESIAVQWAFTPNRLDHKGESVPGARLAEQWLLESYNDSYGEYPPLNQEG